MVNICICIIFTEFTLLSSSYKSKDFLFCNALYKRIMISVSLQKYRKELRKKNDLNKK